MRPEIIRQIGEALYGPRWQTALARDIGVSARTIRHYIAGNRKPLPIVRLAIQRLWAEKIPGAPFPGE